MGLRFVILEGTWVNLEPSQLLRVSDHHFTFTSLKTDSLVI